MQKTFYSFGVSSPYRRYHVEVRHEDDYDPREAIRAGHGTMWAGEYTERAWKETMMATSTTCLLRVTVDEHRLSKSEVFPDAE